FCHELLLILVIDGGSASMPDESHRTSYLVTFGLSVVPGIPICGDDTARLVHIAQRQNGAEIWAPKGQELTQLRPREARHGHIVEYFVDACSYQTLVMLGILRGIG